MKSSSFRRIDLQKKQTEVSWRPESIAGEA